MSKNKPDSIIQQFRTVSRQYSDASIFMHEAIARKAGLTGSDHKYLGLIIQHKELSAGELAKITGLTTGAVTGLIDRLEKKKLVKRHFTEADRRKVMIVPNEENTMKLLQPLFHDLQQRTSALIASFSLTEIRAIERYFVEATLVMKEVTDTINNK
ncbi:MarR family winged helix-turn-helix transcriptional regulator [Spirosoma montaniterrae]|uniref:Transcriptional regulator n=1 Tax=Spirosoma montaniterrae TaxID=1178516 RepID=A0A1P9WVH0_9BACT|nr:MarR family transcriptional regulator [Spirosoma montaniterrae]AQG79374.1 transcriptional regulator [Spirosoma montaniterrae]